VVLLLVLVVALNLIIYYWN